MRTLQSSSIALALLLVAFVPSSAWAQDGAATKAPPVVTLLERGAEPRTELRLRPKEGAGCEREIRISMSEEQRMQGMPASTTTMPKMRLVFTTKVDSVNEEGDIAYTLTFTKAEAGDAPGAHPMLRQQINAVLATMKGVKIRVVVSDRGVMSKSDLDAPSGINPMMRQQMESIADMLDRFSAPLPVEAVGVGAKWTVESEFSRQSMDMRQKATYTLKAVKDGAIELDLELSQDADPQDIKNPMVPPGATTRLLSYKGEGSGALKLNLSEVMHRNSEISLKNETKVSMSMADQTHEVEQRIESEMALSTVQEPADDEGEE